MSGIELQSQFNVQIAKPLDLRAVVADTTARNAIDSAVRYKGMTVYVIGESKFYYLKDGILDTDWTEFSFGSGSGGVKNYFTDPKFDAKTDAAVVYNDYDEPFELDYVSSDADFSNNIFKPGDGVVMIHSFETGDQVRYDIPSGGELLPGLTDGQVYYVIDADVDNHTFKLSETKDGDAVDISAPANATSLSFTEVVYYQGTVGTEDATHLAVSINTTDPQSGLGSLEIDYTYSATTSALGEGVRISTNKIDVQDQGKAQYVYLWFDFSDANYTSGDMKFKLWDKTNSKEIDLEGLGIDTKIYNDARAYNFVFVPPSSTREYYFSLHSVDDNATASWKGKCGTFTMTPQGTAPIDLPNVFSATFAADGTVSNTTADFIDGDATITDTSLFAIKFKDGFFENTPNVAVSFSKNVSNQTQSAVTDSASKTGVSVRTLAGGIKAAEPFTIFVQDVDRAKMTRVIGTNELVSTPLKVLADLSTTSHTSSGNQQEIDWTTTEDNTSSFSGNTFTAPKDIFIFILGSLGFTANSTGNRGISYQINDGDQIAMALLAGMAGNTTTVPFVAGFSLKKGDTVKLTGYQSSGGSLDYNKNLSHLSIYEVPNFSSFSVYSQPIVVKAYCSTSFAASTTVPINYDTVQVDTANAVTTSDTAWKFIAPRKDNYEVSLKGLTSVGKSSASIYKNGTLEEQMFSLVTDAAIGATTIISLDKDDYIDVRPGTASTILPDDKQNSISIKAVGM